MKKILSFILVIFVIFGAINFASSIRGRVDNSNEQIETSKDTNKANEKVDFSKLSFTAFGDSITYGRDGIINGRVDVPYPQAVQNILGLKSNENMGFSSATLTKVDGLRCITEEIISYTNEADIIAVMGGVNDTCVPMPLGDIDDNNLTTIYGALNVQMAYLTTYYKDSFIFYMTPYKENDENGHWTIKNSFGYTLEDVANAVKEVAFKYDIPVLDMFNEGDFESIMYDDDCDGIHPNQRFISITMAPQIASFIKNNYS